MLDDLIKNAKNDEDLVAFLNEYILNLSEKNLSDDLPGELMDLLVDIADNCESTSQKINLGNYEAEKENSFEEYLENDNEEESSDENSNIIVEDISSDEDVSSVSIEEEKESSEPVLDVTVEETEENENNEEDENKENENESVSINIESKDVYNNFDLYKEITTDADDGTSVKEEKSLYQLFDENRLNDNSNAIKTIEEIDEIEERKEFVNTKIRENMQVHQIIRDGIGKHIHSLCIDTCRNLWDKNIYTKKIKVDDEKIEIVLDKLSEDNKSIFERRAKKSKEKYIIDENGDYVLRINRARKSDGTIKNELKNIEKYFFLQDVEIGFLNKEKFLMNICDCEKVEGMKENSPNLNLKIVFDESKMEKTFEEYLKEKDYEHLYIPDENRVYMDEYYLDGHRNYLKSKEEEEN